MYRPHATEKNNNNRDTTTVAVADNIPKLIYKITKIDLLSLKPKQK